MSAPWPMVRLGDVLRKQEDVVDFEPERSYREITVRLWGKGVTLRGMAAGSELAGSRRFVAHAGDLILSKIDARNGAIGLVPDELDGGVVTQDFPLFAHDRIRLEPGYLGWMTKTVNFVQLCSQASEGTTNRVRLKEDRFLGMEIPLPPLEEQRRIVARIEEVATRVESVRRLNSDVTQGWDEACIAMAHRPDLSDSEKEKFGWRHLRFEDLVDSFDDPIQVDVAGKYPNFGIYSYVRGLFSKPAIDGALTSAKTLYRARSGLFIYSRLFAFEGSYGIVDDEFDGSFVSNEYPMFQPKCGICLASFLLAHFKAPSTWAKVADGSRGLGNRRQRVQPDQLRAYSLWVPPMEEQRRIDSVMLLRRDAARYGAAASPNMDALLPSFLDRAFRGEI